MEFINALEVTTKANALVRQTVPGATIQFKMTDSFMGVDSLAIHALLSGPKIDARATFDEITLGLAVQPADVITEWIDRAAPELQEAAIVGYGLGPMIEERIRKALVDELRNLSRTRYCQVDASMLLTRADELEAGEFPEVRQEKAK
jgi:hypothetical protein